MLFEVAFRYSADIRRPRKRSDETVSALASMTVDIPEISRSECPLVMTMKAPDARSDKDVWVDVIAHDGKLFRPAVYHVASGAPDEIMTLEALRGFIASGQAIYHDTGINGANCFWELDEYHRRDTVDLGGGGIKTIVSTNRDECEASIAHRASRYIIVDGQPLIQTAEPIIKLEYSRMRRDGALMPWFRVEMLSENPPDNVYRADRAEELLDRFYEHVPETIAQRSEVLEDVPKIYRPDLLTFDDESLAFRRVTTRAVENVSHRLKDASRAHLIAYADLRDLIAAGAPLDDLEEPLERYIASADFDMSGTRNGLERWRAHRSKRDEFGAIPPVPAGAA